MAVLYKDSLKVIFSLKGAPDTTISLCENYYADDGTIHKIN
jgi:hypothetical protein